MEFYAADSREDESGFTLRVVIVLRLADLLVIDKNGDLFPEAFDGRGDFRWRAFR